MGKFEKSISNDNFEPLRFPAPSSAASVDGDPLKFNVETADRRFVNVDLTRYRDGDNRLGFIGFPKLIYDLLPVIRKNILQTRRSRSAIEIWLSKYVPVLFKAVTDLKRTTGAAPESADEFQDADGVLLKSYLIGLGGAAANRKKQYVGIYRLVREARSLRAPRLRWPSFDIAPERKVHADVDPRAVKALYHACKRVVEGAELNFRRGQLLLAKGVDPRGSSSTGAWKTGERGSVTNRAWKNHANLSILQRKVIKDRIVGTIEIDDKTLNQLHNRTSPSSKAHAGVLITDLVAANAPMALEVVATIMLVSMETGWIDPVWGIDLTGEWYSLRRGDETNSPKKTDSVVIYAVRPKTSKRLTAIGLAGSRFRSFYLIKELQNRTAFLRECLHERRTILQGQEPNTATRREIAEIDNKLRSPWLFYNNKGKGAAAVGLANAQLIHLYLPELETRSISALEPIKKQDPSLIAAIKTLKWSDLRDAFASHIFDNSGGNVFLVKRALDHNHVATTRHYLRQRRQIRQRFDAFRKIMDTALTEAREERHIDPTILFLGGNYDDFNDSDRDKLTAFRSRMGMGCTNPTQPDKHLALTHISGTLCNVQRCVLCRHGIVFKDSYVDLAERHADLAWLRGKIPPHRWLTSSLSWEMEAIEFVRDNVFTDCSDAFNRRFDERLTDINAGRAYVFDDPGIMGGLR